MPQALTHFCDLLKKPAMLTSLEIARLRQVDVDHTGDAARAGRHDGDTVRQKYCLGNTMCNEDDSRVGLPPDAEQFQLHALARHLVECAKGFVHEKDRR